VSTTAPANAAALHIASSMLTAWRASVRARMRMSAPSFLRAEAWGVTHVLEPCRVQVPALSGMRTARTGCAGINPLPGSTRRPWSARAPGVHRGPDPHYRLLPRRHPLAPHVPARLGGHLVLDQDPGKASLRVAPHGALHVHRVAVSRVTIT